MTVRLLLSQQNALEGAAEGALIIGAASPGALLILGTVPPTPNAAAADGATPPPPTAPTPSKTQTTLLIDMLPHGLSVVGAVGSKQAPPPTTPHNPKLWATYDPARAAFAIGGHEVAAPTALVPCAATPASGAKRRADGGVGSLLPANDAFVVVRASMPACDFDALEALLLAEGREGSPLLFSSASASGRGGMVLLSSADDGGDGAAATTTAATTSTTPTNTAASLNGATFVPLVDTTPAPTRSPPAAPVFEYAPPPPPPPPAAADDASAPAPASASAPPLCAQLDALAVVPASAPAARVARDHLVPALRAQLALARRALAATRGGGRPAPTPPPLVARALHFSPPALGFPVTLVYPLPPPASCSAPSLERAEADLAPARRAAHAALGLPPDRPLLRAANALSLGGSGGGGNAPNDASTKSKTTKKLLNVHEAIPTPPPLSGPSVTTSLVRGDYEYCHYLQDRAQDAGWGCAYRSLQTLFSHLRLAGLCSSLPPGGPSHLEAQRALVALGDKPPSFLGSNQWIGAIECGFVLEELAGVRSRVVSARSGGEVGALARELASHFQAHGTPVMVGGGVLAYTLLGVQYDADTGDSAFLILDPHYTGGDSEDDLRTRVVGGGWVAWRRPGERAAAGGALFAPEAFYNFLCPMVPKEV